MANGRPEPSVPAWLPAYTAAKAEARCDIAIQMIEHLAACEPETSKQFNMVREVIESIERLRKHAIEKDRREFNRIRKIQG